MTEQFDELTPAEADEVVARFVEGRPQALAQLREWLVADGQDPDRLLDGSIAILEPLWVWTKGAAPTRRRRLADRSRAVRGPPRAGVVSP